MKRSMKMGMQESMDALRFSREEKDAMVRALTARMGEEQPRNRGGRRMMLAVMAAVMLLAMLTGAAVFTRWSATAQNRYKPSEEVKAQAEKSGLSVMLEETKEADPNEVLSVTDQGITITAVQTIVDKYHAEITFRIEGFELPQGELPAIWPVVSIDGDKHFGGGQGGAFFDGTTLNGNGEWVYVSTGEPVKMEPDGEYESAVLDFVADDGSMEYTHYIYFEETDGRYLGKEIVFSFQSIGFQSHQKAGMPVPQVEGNWELKWTLTGTSDSITVTPNAKIGDSDVILLDVEIGQKTLRARYKVDEYWEGWDELVMLPQAVCGIRMKDGSEHICGAGSSGFEDRETMIYFTEFDMFDVILDISQVESLMFHKGWEADANGDLTVQTFWYIPVDAG